MNQEEASMPKHSRSPFAPRRALWLTALVALTAFTAFAATALPTGQASAGGPVSGATALETLKTLAGNWEGTAGDGDQSFPAQVEYRIASGGTVVMETLFPGTPHEMISMYHMDGDNLVMTHYCALGNQPRMRLDAARSSREHLVFAFVGGTNMDPKRDGHIHSGEIRVQPDGKVTSSWAYYEAGKEQGTKNFSLTRKAS
jgi:hypothetical protein